ncbi:hypothetical protein HK102_010559 [Quaeritorhiza haematococci]|nr:hypothetical protein HK102_010559 [Quaeritorhiza haematococci]
MSEEYDSETSLHFEDEDDDEMVSEDDVGGDSEDEETDDRDSGSDDDDEDGSDDDEATLAQLQRQLAQVPFEQLMKIKAEVGMKEFKTLRQKPGAAAETEQSKATKSRTKETKEGPTERKKPPKRENKNMPMEVTSKRPVSRMREVVEVPKLKARDPRFDPLCGQLNEGLFKSSYGFVFNYEENEIKMLREKIGKEKNPGEKAKMQKLLQRMLSKREARDKKDRRQKIVRDWRKNELELAKQGKKPYYLKEADIKKLELVDKFQRLKGESSFLDKDSSSKKKKQENPEKAALKLEKYLEKKRKRNAAKERRFLPYKRRST